MKKLWARYKLYVEQNYLAQHKGQAKGIPYWRTKIFMNFMLFAFPIGFFIYVPSLIMSIVSDLPTVAIIDTVAILLVGFLVINRKTKLKTKKYILVACFYILSVVLLVYIGSIGPGLIYLLGTSIFMLLTIGTRAGYISILINLAIYFLLALGFLLPESKMGFFNHYTLASWVVVGVNFIFVNTIIIVSVSALLNGLQKTLLKEKTLQQKLIEESIKLEGAKEKAIQSDKLKSAFLANMSHEIRTPLNAIVGFSNIMVKKGKEQKQMYVDIINKSSAQLLSLINDIIDLSKIEAGIVNISEEKIKYGEFFNYIVESMINACPTNLEFHYLLNANKEEEIIIDPQKTAQVITNLITNSFKYTKKGFVKLTASISSDKEMLCFVVEDTGVGIEKKMKQKIFDSFYQIDPDKDGVGLGLSICSSLINAMKGRIDLESEVGKGSKFSVSIPNNGQFAQSLHKQGVLPEEKAIVVKSGLKILIAEDNDSNFLLLEEELLDNNHKITRAKNGSEAVGSIKKSKFDLVFMDIKMPLLNGFEATKQIRQFDTDTPIIAITAFAFNSDKEKAIESGCNAYMAKPINTLNLQKLIYEFSNCKSSQNKQ